MTLRALYDVVAPAKLNLFLHIVGRRPDGYHLLQSLFVLIDWCDTLHFELRDDGQLTRHDVSATLPSDDLCLRAARALQKASRCTKGADISLDKCVPWGAGMGGGSSDAASTLLALNRLWGLNWPRTRLLELGLQLGADVPFFLGGRNAFVQGIGEHLTPVTVQEQWLAVIKPVASVETRTIFNSPLVRRDSEPAIVGGSPEDRLDVEKMSTAGRNDLQAAAEAECAEVAQAAQCLDKWFGNSRMTGSGSAVFARAGSIENSVGQPALPMPGKMAPEWVGRMCRSLTVHPLIGWAAD